MYERLRDFFVPSAVLDDIFSKEDDIIILEDAWRSLLGDGLSEDETAQKIAELVFKETEIDPGQGLEEEEK
jgi:hypothetical protein